MGCFGFGDGKNETNLENSVKQESKNDKKNDEKKDEVKDDDKVSRQPIVFVSHGAGPLPYMKYINTEDKLDAVNLAFFKNGSEFVVEQCIKFGKIIDEAKPKAMLIITAVMLI